MINYYEVLEVSEKASKEVMALHEQKKNNMLIHILSY